MVVRRPEGGVDKLGGEMRGGGMRGAWKGSGEKREWGRHPAFLTERVRESVWHRGDKRRRGIGAGTPRGGGRRKDRRGTSAGSVARLHSRDGSGRCYRKQQRSLAAGAGR
jgi:hypothetical protein